MTDATVRQFLIKVCKVLNNHDVDYLVVGGTAVSHYGHNRPSGIGQYRSELNADLDFWYNPTIENFHKIVGALGDLGVDTSELKKLIFDPSRTFLKIPHQEFHTDFIPVMVGLTSYRASRQRSEVSNLDDVAVNIISY